MNHPRWRLCLIVLCTTQFVALLDFSITMIPLPQIQESLGFTPGALLAGLALLGMSLAVDTSWAFSILPGTVLAGVGYGIAFPVWTVAGIEGVAEVDHGLAGGMLTTTQEVGSAVGLAVGVAVSIAVLADGGSSVQGFSYAILVSACMVVLGLIGAALILPGKASTLALAR
ncbi:MAG: hypothetical protein ACRC1I_17215 [Pseudomonas proteolytica]|uniref:hypothetical protein n=1 Tax=Pseudomonas proteolytica TaxID=219574 RepID=UPI003F399AA0